MERYQQHRTASISRIISIYHTGWQVQADQEDGIAKIDLPFLQHLAPHSWGFLFVEGCVDLDYEIWSAIIPPFIHLIYPEYRWFMGNVGTLR